jgi:hypothetical protein
MAFSSSQDEIQHNKELKEKVKELERIGKQWIKLQRDVLNAQVDFLKKIKEKRGQGNLISLNTNYIDKITKDLFKEFLGQ